MDYLQLLEQKKRTFADSGFICNTEWAHLYPFQQYCVRMALKKGRFALFEDCGLGKTRQQLTWANEVVSYTNKPVLILAPLAVVDQTIQEARRIGMDKDTVDNYFSFVDDSIIQLHPQVVICNYEQLENIDCSLFAGVVLDESSIIKNMEGVYRNFLVENFRTTQFKLCCTATPSPNDPMELGNHAEFLNAMNYNEMLSMYFVHDGGETSKWRLKGHSESVFWDFVSSWAIMLSRPSDIGFSDEGYNLPPLSYNEKIIITEKKNNGSLFNDTAISATTHNAELRLTKIARLDEVAAIVNSSDESFIIWVKQNEEGEALRKLIPDCVEMKGSDSLEQKKFVSLWFTNQDNECICNTKEMKKSTNQSTGQNITQKIKNQSLSQQQKDLRKKENQTPNLDNQKLSTTESTTQKIKINSENNNLNQKTEKTKEEGSCTHLMKNTENEQREMQDSNQLTTQEQYLKTELKNTGLVSNNTNPYCENKTINAQYAEANPHLLIQNKDYTLTIATKQTKSEDYYAQTAIKELENSMIQKYCSTVQFCTCCGKAKRKILVTKTKIMGYGINAQNCHNMIFASPDFSFEGLYQSIRREWRFGQKNGVNVWLITTDTMQNILTSIKRKQAQFEDMQRAMQQSMNSSFKHKQKMERENKTYKSDWADMRLGDSLQLVDTLPDNSVGFSIWSPPFPELYVYSDELEDMGNCKDYDEFMRFFSFIPKKLMRVMQPGRNIAIHCMDTPIQKGKEGYIGLRDFSGGIIQQMIAEGFILHSKVTIWKNPVTEMQRTKALGLLHKQVKKDSAMSRVGIPDYLLVFRKPGTNENPIKCPISVDTWQQYASPVWMDIDYGNTLNKNDARDEKDEKHICPLQIDTIKRATILWSNEGDTCLSMFGGIGSEATTFIELNRKAVSFELKTSYFDVSIRNVKDAESKKSQKTLF